MTFDYLILVYPTVGFVGMLAGGYWGVGCGWLVVPTLLIMGVDPVEAVGISLLQMVPSSLPTVIKSASSIGWKRGQLGLSLILPLALGAFVASFAGKPINTLLAAKYGDTPLMILFALLMVFIGVQTLCSRAQEYENALPPVSGKDSFIASLVGLGTGVFSSLLGVGGAIFFRPVLASGFKVPELYTAVSVRLLLLITTATGGVTYLFKNGAVDWYMLVYAGMIAVGGIIGFPLGVKLHKLVLDAGYAQQIHKSFALVAATVLANTVLKIFGFAVFSRYLMLGIALGLLIYLVSFGYYAKQHKKNIAK